MGFLSEYELRTAWKYEPVHGSFMTNDRLMKKVDGNGRFLPFPGSTTVFRLDRRGRTVLGLMQQNLHRHLEGTGMLAERLSASTLHMTLHDLVCPERHASPEGNARLYALEVRDSAERADGIVEGIRKDFAGACIVMEADRIVSMVSASLVLLLRPKTEADYEMLMEMYRRFDPVMPLDYPLTPHITLAYYKPGILDGSRLNASLEAAQIGKEDRITFPLYPEALTAALFTDMQHYADYTARICFLCDGGLNRSVMACAVLNHLARQRGLPIRGEARAARRGTEGREVPEVLRKTLELHGITMDGMSPAARYMEEHEAAWFTGFAPVTAGAADRLAFLGVPEDRISQCFMGVRDPEFGEVSHEQVFSELYDRTVRYLDSMPHAEEIC